MKRSATPVVNSGQRLSRLEARRDKLLVAIERTQRRFDKLDKGAQRALKQLAKLERQRRRMDKAMAKAKAETADELITTTAKPDVPVIRTDDPNVEKVAAALDADRNSDGLDIPAALDRNRKLQTLPNPRTKEKKAERRAVEREIREAELTGKRRRIPLTGKAAMQAIAKA